MRRTVIAVALLTGCASTGGYQVNVLQAVGDAYAGRALGAMTSRYGAPLRSMPAGDVTIYSWEVRDVLYFDTQAPLHVRCQLDAYVQDGTVETVGLNGQQGACERFLP